MAVTTNPKVNKVAILDEGITLTDDVSSIDFTGAGVTGSILGQSVTENIPGAAAPATEVVGEEMNTTGDPVVFTLDFVPVDEPRVFIGSARVFEGLTNDYTRAGLTFTFLFTPQTTPKADYSH